MRMLEMLNFDRTIIISKDQVDFLAKYVDRDVDNEIKQNDQGYLIKVKRNVYTIAVCEFLKKVCVFQYWNQIGTCWNLLNL